jgi:multiple sugar transport system substrate-binding protein
MIRKKIFLIIVLVLLVSFFASVSSVLAASSSDEQIKISFTWWGDTKRHELYNAIVDLFEKAYPNIKVDRIFAGWADYWDKLAISIAGGNAPDVIGMHPFLVSDYVPRGALLKLKPYVDSGIIDISHIPESVYKSGFVNDQLYLIAQGVSITAYIYNTVTLDELGVSHPDMDWTWKEFADKCIEIKEAAKAKGKEMYGSYDNSMKFMPSFSNWARSLKGEDAYTSDGKLGFTEDTLTSWFSFWKDLRDKGAVPDAATTTEYYRESVPEEQNLFNVGKCGIYQEPANGLWLTQDLVTNGGDVNLVRMPHSENGGPGEIVEGSHLGITSVSKHPEEAAKFINFFINNTEAQKIFKLEQGVPCTTTAIEAILNDLTPPQKRTIDFAQYALKIAAVAAYPPKGNGEITARFEEIGYEVAYGKITPKEGAIKFMQEANDILSKQ